MALSTLKPQKSPVHNPTNITYISKVGERVVNDSCDVLAKSVEIGGITTYYVKQHTCGCEAGHLVNPFSMYDVILGGMDTYTGKPRQDYRKVSKEVYDLYTTYLTTESDVHYRQAERLVSEEYL